MVNSLNWLLVIGVFASLFASLFFSYKSRRARDGRQRGMNAAKMNIFMGVMLMLVALLFMLVYSGSTVKVIIGTLFIVIGLFNLFAGLRNHSVYRSMK
ncbi:YtpI family protein [Paenibacillus mendelii]|uniref:YtpI family protein n=1 Tax=Paenibacillus mendelii TaxID=206163 RepID=A0ABV6JBC6_9BACL|nr:YtpI family protein [Paenibacillus mendelii]MCQ6558561.1 YtpI family protein [Paenibacillus mendelii]